MKPEEYPSETFCKYTNIVTGVLEYFERLSLCVLQDLRPEPFRKSFQFRLLLAFVWPKKKKRIFHEKSHKGILLRLLGFLLRSLWYVLFWPDPIPGGCCPRCSKNVSSKTRPLANAVVNVTLNDTLTVLSFYDAMLFSGGECVLIVAKCFTGLSSSSCKFMEFSKFTRIVFTDVVPTGFLIRELAGKVSTSPPDECWAPAFEDSFRSYH